MENQTPMSVADAASALDQMMLPLDGEQQKTDKARLTEEETQEVAVSVDEELDVQDDESNEETTEEQSELDEETEEEEKPAEVYTVKVDGKEVEVTLDELQKGYSRTQDYTRKTQQIAETRKQVEAEASAIRAEREQYAQLLGALKQQLESADTPIDLERLRYEDPIEWVTQRELLRDKQDKLAAIQSEQQRLSQLTAQQRAQEMQAHLASQQEALIQAVPEWKDSKKAQAEKALLVEFGKKIGFSDEELKNVYDHRAVIALRKAALYDQMMSKRGQIKPVVNNGPRPAKPSAAGRVSTTTESTRAKQRLAKSGRVNDAASAIELLLK
ncbi:hypothetical protein UFOVP515_26 [uncultured Caudovirales phage]|uniref:Scaffolding protein n=1 Tax=uncultured Caudovirales phage TaxID=2100421 RepID=A0A6J5MKT2_9CAUD|nr:hypothetical protein UFOVP515_26 [uncultured Caudovirales phage]